MPNLSSDTTSTVILTGIKLISFAVLIHVLIWFQPHRPENEDLKTHTLKSSSDSSSSNSTQGPIARAFPSWPSDKQIPCAPVNKTSYLDRKSKHLKRGLFYLKTYKTGSSTIAGVQLRLARAIAKRRGLNMDEKACSVGFEHGPQPFPAYSMYRDRYPDESFLWTTIRDPSKRLVSGFFHFTVSRQGHAATSENFKKLIESRNFQDYYLRAFPTTKQFNRDKHDPLATIRQILSEYDFIAVTERMDESLVVLTMLFGLPLGDVLYLRANSHGEFDGGADGICTFIQPSFVSSPMQKLLESDSWRNQSQYDLALYEAANLSLDLTIEKLGREAVATKVEQFRQAQQQAHDICRPITRFPCQNGYGLKSEDCLWRDGACGYHCLDQLAHNISIDGL